MCPPARLLRIIITKIGSCINKVENLRTAYDELFSYERGRYFVLKGVVMEIVEVINQTSQLISFSHERPIEWVVGLSVVLMLNGLLVPVPFVVMRLVPGWNKAARLILAGVDVAFDSGCLLITILHSQRSDFPRNWWIATLGVVVPIARIIWQSTRLPMVVAKEAKKQSSGHRITFVFVLISIFSIVGYLSANGNRRRPGL